MEVTIDIIIRYRSSPQKALLSKFNHHVEYRPWKKNTYVYSTLSRSARLNIITIMIPQWVFVRQLVGRCTPSTTSSHSRSSRSKASAAEDIQNHIEYGNYDLYYKCQVIYQPKQVKSTRLTVVIAPTIVMITPAMAEMIALMPAPIEENMAPYTEFQR